MDAEAALDVLGVACISMLSDSLKLYFKTLEERVIGFDFENRKAAFRGGSFPPTWQLWARYSALTGAIARLISP